MTPVFQTGIARLFTGSPLALGQHGTGLLAGCTVDQVVAEEDLRRCSAGSTVLGGIVGRDVHGRGGRGGDHLDGHSLAVGAGHTVGLAFGGLDDELQVGHVRRDTGQREGEGAEKGPKPLLIKSRVRLPAFEYHQHIPRHEYRITVRNDFLFTPLNQQDQSVGI